jgi:hypothetical protein
MAAAETETMAATATGMATGTDTCMQSRMIFSVEVFMGEREHNVKEAAN